MEEDEMMFFGFLGIGLLVYYLLQQDGRINMGGNHSALEILDNRYANGEIDTETYNEMKVIIKG